MDSNNQSRAHHFLLGKERLSYIENLAMWGKHTYRLKSVIGTSAEYGIKYSDCHDLSASSAALNFLDCPCIKTVSPSNILWNGRWMSPVRDDISIKKRTIHELGSSARVEYVNTLQDELDIGVPWIFRVPAPGMPFSEEKVCVTKSGAEKATLWFLVGACGPPLSISNSSLRGSWPLLTARIETVGAVSRLPFSPKTNVVIGFPFSWQVGSQFLQKSVRPLPNWLDLH